MGIEPKISQKVCDAVLASGIAAETDVGAGALPHLTLSVFLCVQAVLGVSWMEGLVEDSSASYVDDREHRQ